MTDVNQSVLTFAEMDADGALQETAEKAFGRSDFLRKMAIGSGGLIGGGMLAGAFAERANAQVPQSDVDILNFALTLEELEAAFYVRGVLQARLTGRLRVLAITVRNHELAHVRFLRKALGSAAIAAPKFNFRTTTRSPGLFLSTAITLEDTGVAAYQGQAPNIKTPSILAAAGAILSVEARHAAAFRQLRGVNPAPLAFNPARNKAQILAIVTRTGFIVS